MLQRLALNCLIQLLISEYWREASRLEFNFTLKEIYSAVWVLLSDMTRIKNKSFAASRGVVSRKVSVQRVFLQTSYKYHSFISNKSP